MPRKKSPQEEPTEKQKQDAREARDKKVKELLKLAQVYEDYLEPRIVLLYRRIVEMLSASGMPLVQINMVLDLVKRDLVDLSHDAYSKRGSEKLLTGRRMENRIG